MKRKKWSELEEQTLLTKYNDLLASGNLSKLKTREKKFRPIADHVNAVHHLHDPAAFPFKWSWRDVSIKVQNMRHQYLGVKQKIRISNDEFNWKDGENHWENFLKYKEVFGDVELEVKGKKFLSDSCSSDLFRDCGDLGLGIDSEDLEDDEEEEEEEDGELREGDSCDDDDDDDDHNLKQGNPGDDCNGAGGVGEDQGVELLGGEKVSNCGHGGDRKGKLKGVSKRLGLLGAQVVDLRDVVVRREEKRREREFDRENGAFECEERRRKFEFRRGDWQEEKEEKLEKWGMELEERELGWGRKEFERRLRVERDLEEKRRQMRAMEEKREEEEMEWRERVLRLQIEHEKTIMQVHAEACHNQMQILGVMARLVCQFYGSAADGLGGGLGGLPSQVLQNLQHPGGLGDNGKPDSSSPSEFL